MIERRKNDVELRQIKRTLSKHDGMHIEHSSRIDEAEQDISDLQDKQCPGILNKRKVIKYAKAFTPVASIILFIVLAWIFGADKAMEIFSAVLH